VDALIALSKEGYSLNSKRLKDGGMVIYDSSLVPEVSEKRDMT
jgi:Pyruvate ferredoxin/flavodoxin oxidoreductase.